MFARLILILICGAPLTAYGNVRPPFGPPGYELPDVVTDENLYELSDRMDRAGCGSRACRVMMRAIGEVITNANQRKNGDNFSTNRPPDIAYSAIRYREIERDLREVRTLWPDICRAVVAIAARDAFASYPLPYSRIAGAALDVSRHLRGPHLDCVSDVLAVMPESKRKQAALDTVWLYCLDERRGTARCARFKPTDPEFLPVPWPPHLP